VFLTGLNNNYKTNKIIKTAQKEQKETLHGFILKIKITVLIEEDFGCLFNLFGCPERFCIRVENNFREHKRFLPFAPSSLRLASSLRPTSESHSLLRHGSHRCLKNPI
jgi:hypothetical protein